ncbi:MAG: YtxH domain-containing protein [Chloroflexi bacterium]|nr:YtxH domain-containing protein [Chloroflexota bacterium]
MSERDSGGGFFSGFILGGLAGVALGLLLAPRPGQETLEQIREKGTELQAKGRELWEDESGALREAIQEVREILRETVEEGREVLKEAIEEGREASAKAAEELQTRFEAVREGRERPS